MRNFGRIKIGSLLTILILIISLEIITVVGDPFDETTVSVSPVGQIVGPNDNFIISVYCDPGQPIKAFELKLSFNASLVQALEVLEGDIFDGYTTFFNEGIINNSVGTIVEVYGLIVGAGNVSDSGVLVNISFIGGLISGISDLVLYDVGITNETAYIPISLVNGSVQIDASSPVVSDVSASPGSQEISGFVNISAMVVDNVAIDTVCINITYPDDSWENFSIKDNKTGDIYYCNKSYDMIGLYSYLIWANDTVGNSDTSAGHLFVIGDMTSPDISSYTFMSSNPLDTDVLFGWLNISCDVTDNIGVDDVIINISNPDGSWNNVSLSHGSGNSYYINSSSAFSQVGNYSYYLWAEDTSNNTAISSVYYFSMPPNWDVNNDGVINIVDLVLVSNHYDETGNLGWIREDVDNNGEILVFDLVVVSNHYGEIWWDE